MQMAPASFKEEMIKKRNESMYFQIGWNLNLLSLSIAAIREKWTSRIRCLLTPALDKGPKPRLGARNERTETWKRK